MDQRVEKLKRWMYETQVTAANLARMLGCTPPILSYILNGKKRMSDEMERRLKKVGVRL
jgi:plasmid maintenance system antidote protein VapI